MTPVFTIFNPDNVAARTTPELSAFDLYKKTSLNLSASFASLSDLTSLFSQLKNLIDGLSSIIKIVYNSTSDMGKYLLCFTNMLWIGVIRLKIFFIVK